MYGPDEARIATPIGMVTITGDGHGVTGIAIDPSQSAAPREGSTPPVRATATQLSEYFAGTRTGFDLPLAPAKTPRGQALREAMVAIDYGDTRTYGEVATTAGSSARAIGGACRRNPLPIVVPCHRVLSASGTDFYSAGAGPETKQWLLAHERNHKDA